LFSTGISFGSELLPGERDLLRERDVRRLDCPIPLDGGCGPLGGGGPCVSELDDGVGGTSGVLEMSSLADSSSSLDSLLGIDGGRDGCPNDCAFSSSMQ
jgi:hypothetical protein